MISRRRGYKFTKWTQLYNQAVVRFIYEVSGQSISKLYMWMGWGRAEGSKKMKEKKIMRRSHKRRLHGQQGYLLSHQQKKPALITMDNKSQKGNGSTRQREAMKVCTIWPNRLGELEHKNLTGIFHTSRAMMWMKRKRSRR